MCSHHGFIAPHPEMTAPINTGKLIFQQHRLEKLTCFFSDCRTFQHQRRGRIVSIKSDLADSQRAIICDFAERRLLYFGIAFIRVAVARNRERESGSCPIVECRPKMTAMGFKYGPANRKHYADSILFRCVERFDRAGQQIRGRSQSPEWPNA